MIEYTIIVTHNLHMMHLSQYKLVLHGIKCILLLLYIRVWDNNDQEVIELLYVLAGTCMVWHILVWLFLNHFTQLVDHKHTIRRAIKRSTRINYHKSLFRSILYQWCHLTRDMSQKVLPSDCTLTFIECTSVSTCKPIVFDVSYPMHIVSIITYSYNTSYIHLHTLTLTQSHLYPCNFCYTHNHNTIVSYSFESHQEHSDELSHVHRSLL